MLKDEMTHHTALRTSLHEDFELADTHEATSEADVRGLREEVNEQLEQLANWINYQIGQRNKKWTSQDKKIDNNSLSINNLTQEIDVNKNALKDINQKVKDGSNKASILHEKFSKLAENMRNQENTTKRVKQLMTQNTTGTSW